MIGMPRQVDGENEKIRKWKRIKEKEINKKQLEKKADQKDQIRPEKEKESTVSGRQRSSAGALFLRGFFDMQQDGVGVGVGVGSVRSGERECLSP
jgi:hypothetical protein